MGDPAVISAFEGEWAFLSNFWVGAEPLRYRTFQYASGEHMFQAFKASSVADHARLADSGTPAEARANGKHYLRLRMDWERVKFDVMRLVLRAKFQPGREECALLLATGDALLVEGTMWGDRTWGVDLKAGRQALVERLASAPLSGDWRPVGGGAAPVEHAWEPGEGWELAPGLNWLGVLLMARRAELAAELRGARFGYGTVARVVEDLPPGVKHPA